MDTFYVDPISLALSRGIRVIPNPSLDVNGQIYKQEDGSIVIEYDNTMHPNRQRFTIAHELGHFIAGHLETSQKKFRDPAKNFTLDNYDPQEAEANRIAAMILMPQDKIDFLINEAGIASIHGISNALKVSPAAITYRLKNLGYIS